MNPDLDFEDIRPYYDREINPALNRIVAVPEFGKILEFLFPERPGEQIISELKQINSALAFQQKFMYPLVYSIVDKTSKGLTSSGFDHLTPGIPYLFVANHRDIVLDSALLQVLLFDHGHETSEITFGSNLMINQFIIDLGKVNRMFKVYRGGNRKEIFRNSQILSAYLRHTITRKRVSAWIAQRSGRTKDGFDKTESGLLKMFNISGSGNLDQSLGELNLVPLSVSYEYEPCCALKIREISTIMQGEIYQKEPGEDFRSILAGITQPKGRIHLAVCRPINQFLADSAGIENYNDRINKIAGDIDREIYRNYRLWPTNYIAADLLRSQKAYAEHYSPVEKDQFIAYMHRELDSLGLDLPGNRELLLKTYANPVWNAEAQD